MRVWWTQALSSYSKACSLPRYLLSSSSHYQSPSWSLAPLLSHFRRREHRQCGCNLSLVRERKGEGKKEKKSCERHPFINACSTADNTCPGLDFQVPRPNWGILAPLLRVMVGTTGMEWERAEKEEVMNDRKMGDDKQAVKQQQEGRKKLPWDMEA